MFKAAGSALLLAVALPLVASADLKAGDLPAATEWYVHADLAELRLSEPGRPLYDWLDGEVTVELNEELRIDLEDAVHRFTAFSTDGSGVVAIVEGNIDQELQDRVLAAAFAGSEGKVDQTKYAGATYYKAGDDESATRLNDEDSIRHSGYFSFAVDGKILAASEEDQIRALIDSGGRIPGAGDHNGAIIVLSADKQFVQAGMRTAEFADDGDDWNSNILRNTEQAALLISEQRGLIAMDLTLIGSDPEMTASLGSIVNGLIALQAFSSELEPEILAFLRNTRVDVNDTTLKVSTVLDPNDVVKLLGD